MKIKALLYSDGSQRSLSAAIYAAALMKGNPHMSLTIISCRRPAWGPAAVVWDEGWSAPEAIRGLSAAILAEARKIFEDRDIPVETHSVTCGDRVAEEIAAFAREGNFNLVIMGTKGPGDLRALVLGSLAHQVVHLCDRPVLLVKKLPPEILAALERA